VDSVSSLETRTDLFLLDGSSPKELHHLGVLYPFPRLWPLPQEDVCSLIYIPQDVYCFQREELTLGQQEDLVSKLV